MYTNEQALEISARFREEMCGRIIGISREDFVQECWVDFLQLSPQMPLDAKITEAIKSAWNRNRPNRSRGKDVHEIPMSNEQLDKLRVHLDKGDDGIWRVIGEEAKIIA